MKFGISRVWGDVFEVKEFHTLDELIDWVKETNEEVIIKINPSQYKQDKIQAKRDFEYELEIYDGYRE